MLKTIDCVGGELGDDDVFTLEAGITEIDKSEKNKLYLQVTLVFTMKDASSEDKIVKIVEVLLR